MTQYIVIFGFIVLMFVLMSLALHFSKYKKIPSECCGGGHCSTDSEEKDGVISYSCDHHNMKYN